MPRIYIDGIFDVFHIGHIDCLNKCKNFRTNSELIVGVIGDNDAEEYKRKPIFNENDRYKIINSLRIVDEIIFPAPLIITKDFIKKHKIDIVLHGFSNKEDYEKQKDFFKDIQDIFHTIPYNGEISTTKLIEQIKNL